MEISKFMVGLFTMGMALLAVGKLPQVTRLIARLAIDAQKNDQVSLGAWNRSLLRHTHHQDHK